MNLLEKLQIVKSIGNHVTKYFDSRMDKHYHILCTSCYEIADVEANKIQDLENKVVQETGFQVLEDRLQLFGLCPTCTSQTAQIIHFNVFSKKDNEYFNDG